MSVFLSPTKFLPVPRSFMWHVIFFGRELEDLEKKLNNQVLDALDKER